MTPDVLPAGLTRRAVLAGGGLLLGLSLARGARAQALGPLSGATGGLPGDLAAERQLDQWIRIDPDGRVTAFTGKVELGQGITTALVQVAAEELDLDPAAITLVSGDTARVPDEGLTAASHSMQFGGTALAFAAANVRRLLLAQAARDWGSDPSELATTGDGRILGPGGRSAGYGGIAARISLAVEADPDVALRDPARHRVLGRDLPRRDIPAKLSGGAAFLQDLRLPGMLHARVVRGPSAGTRLLAPDLAAARQMPGVATVVEDGDFAAVVAEGEWQAVQALRAAQTGPFERPGPALPAAAGAESLLEAPLREIPVGRSPAGSQDPVVRLAARYSRPWLSHGSIGPSCAVAWAREGGLTLWSHSQGVFDMKRAIAELTGLPPEKVRVIFTPGAGCYGQNGADDVTAEAALIAMALPGRPVRLQWMRAQEFGWEPCGVAGVTEVEAGLDARSRVTGWRYRVWSNPHDARATGAGGFVAAQQIAAGFPAPVLEPLPMPAGGGDRNADPIYDFAGMDIRYEFAAVPLERGSAMRSLGGQLNVLSIESMLDELALAAGADPLEVRLANLPDPRGIAVLRRAAAAFGWEGRQRGDGHSGAGLGFARYKNQGAYCAVALEITVDRDSGRIRVGRVVAAADAGQIASPDGVRNQIEGGVIQSLSWAMLEQVAMDPRQRTSLDWGRYPILRFDQVPERLDVHLLDQPGAAFLGVAEAAQGTATAALANALADATGLRLRDLPLSPRKLSAALRGQAA